MYTFGDSIYCITKVYSKTESNGFDIPIAIVNWKTKYQFSFLDWAHNETFFWLA